MRLRLAAVCAAVILFVPTGGYAQSSSVQGQVVDTTGGPLPGVSVLIGDGVLRGVTDANGRYRIRDVPPGEHTVEATFLGYATATAPVTVQAGAIAIQDFTLEPAAIEIEGLTVEAQRGILRTLETKRSSPVIVDVLDRETLLELPFHDMVEGLDQLPAVHVRGLSAERGFKHSFIVVRGIQPSLNGVTIAGLPLASTTGDRAVALDVLPGGLASQLEVRKTITPDMDANAIGGTANIVPMSAFDRRGAYLALSVQGAVQDEAGDLTSDQLPLNFDLAGSTRLGETFGVAAVGSFKQETFATAFSQPDGWEPIPQPEFPETLFVPEGTRLEQSRSGFERYSGTVNLDWRPRAGTSLSLLTSYTRTTDEQTSTQTEWNYADGKDNIAFELLSPTTILSPQGENEKEMDIDEQEETLFFTLADADLQLGPLDWGVTGSYMRGELDALVREWSFNSMNFASTIDVSGEIPWATAVDEAAFNDPSSYTFAEIDIEPNVRETESFQIGSDLQLDTDALGHGGFLKAGAIFRSSDTRADGDELQMEVNPAAGVTDVSLTGLGLAFPAGPVRGRPVGPAIHPFLGPEFVAANPEFLLLNENAAVSGEIESDYAVDETVIAGYVMASAEWDRWQIIGGARIERTETQSDFKVFNENTSAINEEFETNDYVNVLPNLQLRYRVTDDLQLRGAFTQTIARANLSQLAGARDIDFDNSDIVAPGIISDASVSQGNPLLEPFKAVNLDATIEFYPRRGSFYMAGVFYKNIDDAIFVQTLEDEDVTLGGTLYQRIEFQQPLNAKSGHLIGLEAQAQETFTFLPNPLDGLGVSASLAYLDSEFEIPGREGEDLPLFQQPDLTLSVAPSFGLGDLEARVAYQYTDEYVVSFGGNPDDDEFFDARETIDLQLSYDWRDSYTVVLGAKNLTDADLREFQGVSTRTSQLESLGRSFWLGLRARFQGLGSN